MEFDERSCLMSCKVLQDIQGRGSRPAGLTMLLSTMMAVVFAVGLLAQPQMARAKAPPDSFADLAERLLPSVVNIATIQRSEERRGWTGPNMPQFPPGSDLEEFFKDFIEPRDTPSPRQSQSLGSGFIIDEAGIVVTNNHVIADADKIQVRLQSGGEFVAEVVGRDPKIDVAVLKIDPGDTKLTAVSFGDSDTLRVGDWVVAIGNPFGLGGTVTAGIVSARGRDIRQGPYDDFIQTDASINKGNSGGPLFNLEGDVVGINTAIYSQTGGSVGIAFAVTSSLAEPVIAQLREFGRTRRGWLGVRIQTVGDDIAESLELDKKTGAVVVEVTPGGPAAAAGLKAKDVILEFNEQKIETMRELPRIVAKTPVGTEVPVVIWRDGKRLEVTVLVAELEAAESAQIAASDSPVAAGRSEVEHVEELDLELSVLTDSLRKRFTIAADVTGVVITEIGNDSPALEKGLRPGDVVVEVDQEEVDDPEDVIDIIRDIIAEARKKSILFTVNRQGSIRFVGLRVSKS